ncbi:MAG: cell division protein ZipA C-terminal FtsZ-binding domain-containing protein [Neisseria sp.]|nr:cell division protein ZipA C-terminal FtsZ-binding domain-containing protein [Neisseria sp.]
MNQSVLWVLVLAAAIILAVLAYNLYQENQYRKKIRAQFGHADRDALLEGAAQEVRDGSSGRLNPFKKSAPQAEKEDVPHPATEETIETPLPNEEFYEKDILSGEETPAHTYQFSEVTLAQTERTAPAATQKLLIPLKDLQKTELPWFNPNFDYMAYVSLRAPRELSAMPRLSNRHRFRIAGCTMDGQFQLAEPIPGVDYQAFVIGLQAISRSGLAGTADLEQFGEKVNEFAQHMDGGLHLTDVAAFLRVARPLDELCARVDQIIAIHLVSRTSIVGSELRATLESVGFELSHDGAFYFPNADEALFRVVELEDKPFTAALLAAQNYRGFSMLFDITHVPPGEKNFDRFMDLAVRLASILELDLVDDKTEVLSTQWLRNIGDYVAERQDEMRAAGIVPGDELAQRLFA